MCTNMDDIPTLRRILKDSHVIAMVGLSASWYRPSYFAAKYMLDHGYRVIPVDRKSTRLNSSHIQKSRMPSSA